MRRARARKTIERHHTHYTVLLLLLLEINNLKCESQAGLFNKFVLMKLFSHAPEQHNIVMGCARTVIRTVLGFPYTRAP